MQLSADEMLEYSLVICACIRDPPQGRARMHSRSSSCMAASTHRRGVADWYSLHSRVLGCSSCSRSTAAVLVPSRLPAPLPEQPEFVGPAAALAP